MNFIDRIRAFMAPLREQKVSGIAPLFARFNAARPQWSARNFEKFSEEGYQKCGVVFRCINEIAKGVAAVPLCIYDGYGDDEREIEDRNHPLHKLLARPNPFRGGAAWFADVVSYYLLHGNAYIEGVSPNQDGAAPLELYCHRPDRIKIIPDSVLATSPRFYRYDYSGGYKLWEVNPLDGTGPILHWKTFNPRDDWYGQSMLEAASYSIDQHNEAGAWNQALLQNGAAPSGGFKYAPEGAIGATLTREQRDQLQKDIEERISGPRNAGRPLILDGGIDWVAMGLTPRDMDWLNGKKSSAQDICAVFGVPTQIVGIEGSQTFANFEEARLALYQECILPLLDGLLDELNHWLAPLYGDSIHIRIDHDGIDALAPIREAVWARITASTWLTTNEKRQATGYEPLDDASADSVLVPATLLPLGQPAGTDSATPDALNSSADGQENRLEDGAPAPAAGAGGVRGGGVPGGDGAPAPEGSGGNAAPLDSVQAAGLSGQQIQQITAILEAVTGGQMAPEAAVLVLQLAFPSMKPEAIQQMVDAANGFEPEEEEEPVPPTGMLAATTPGKPKQPAPPQPVPPEKQLAMDLRREGFSRETAAEMARLAYGEDA